jgi:hypothetical protein
MVKYVPPWDVENQVKSNRGPNSRWKWWLCAVLLTTSFLHQGYTMSMQRQSNVQHLERQRDQLCGVVDQGVLNNAVSMLYYSVAPDNRPQECTRILNELSALLVPNPLQVFIRMWTDAVGGTLAFISPYRGCCISRGEAFQLVCADWGGVGECFGWCDVVWDEN